MLLGVEPGRSGIKFTGKLGKRAGTSPARSAIREPDEEAKGQIDHMLLADLTSPSLAAVLRSVSSAYDFFKSR